MLLDDRPDYPMAFVFQLKLSGEMRRSAFESSFEEALSRHPLLCAWSGRSARSGLSLEACRGAKADRRLGRARRSRSEVLAAKESI